jgi:hypothetical protein
VCGHVKVLLSNTLIEAQKGFGEVVIFLDALLTL